MGQKAARRPEDVPCRGVSLKNVSYWAFVFSVFSRNQEKTKTLTHYNRYAHVPGPDMWARTRVQVLQNSGSQMVDEKASYLAT